MSLQTNKSNCSMGAFHRQLSHEIASLPASETLPVGFCSGCEALKVRTLTSASTRYTQNCPMPSALTEAHTPPAKKTEVFPPSCHSQCSPTCFLAVLKQINHLGIVSPQSQHVQQRLYLFPVVRAQDEHTCTDDSNSQEHEIFLHC